MPEKSVSFCKILPGGNPTILVHSLRPLPDAAGRSRLAAALMRPESVGGEQAGFLIGPPSAPEALIMMGGEFCANACRAAGAAISLLYSGSPEGQFRCSGLAFPVRYAVRLPASGPARASVSYRLPRAAFRISSPLPGSALVELPGISHLLLDAVRHPPEGNLPGQAAAWRGRCGLEQREAAGVVWIETGGNGRDAAILPVVWVRATDTAVAESACGSATLALALASALLPGFMSACGRGDIAQPSGMTLSAEWDEETERAMVDGPVAIAAEGRACVPE